MAARRIFISDDYVRDNVQRAGHYCKINTDRVMQDPSTNENIDTDVPSPHVRFGKCMQSSHNNNLAQ